MNARVDPASERLRAAPDAPRPAPPRPRWRRLRRLAKLLVAGLLLRGAEAVLDLADPPPLERIPGWPASRLVLAADGTTLGVRPSERGEHRLPVSIDELPPHVVAAAVAAEDGRFFEHGGVDLLAAARATWQRIARGRTVSGASTITMQLVRILEPRERTLLSKLLEVRRARQVERRLTKRQILEAWLNLAPFGGTVRGIDAASRRWFGKPASRLLPEEAAALAVMLPAPSRRALDRAGPRLLGSRDRVLERMGGEGALAPSECERARASPLDARRHPWGGLAPHFCAFALERSRAAAVATRLDPGLQRRAESAAASATGGGADGVAIVVLRREDGEPVAWVGGREPRPATLDAARRRRSAGSTLKPFLYALAFERGIAGPETLLADEPVSYGGYAPQNFGRTYRGAVAAGDALSLSRNVPAVRLLAAVGVERFTDVLRVLGVPAGARDLHLAAALGTTEISPYELARAWARFAAPHAPPGLSRWARDRVLAGLASRPLPGLPPAARGFAWKTGTSSDRRDAWCVGVDDRHVAVVWLGRLRGGGAPDLVGSRAAARVIAGILGDA